MKPYYEDELVTLYHGDCLEVLPTLIRHDGLPTVDAVVADPFGDLREGSQLSGAGDVDIGGNRGSHHRVRDNSPAGRQERQPFPWWLGLFFGFLVIQDIFQGARDAFDLRREQCFAAHIHRHKKIGAGYQIAKTRKGTDGPVGR